MINRTGFLRLIVNNRPYLEPSLSNLSNYKRHIYLHLLILSLLYSQERAWSIIISSGKSRILLCIQHMFILTVTNG